MPSNVAWFEKLMYLTLAIGVLISALDFARLSAEAGPVFVIVTQAIVFAILILLIWAIARRRKSGARWVFVVFFVLGLAMYVPALMAMFRASALIGALSCLQLAIQAVALYLVFTGNAKDWFKKPAAA